MKKSFVAKLSAVALALMLSLGFGTAVCAEDDPDPAPAATTAVIVKELEMDTNVTTPVVTFQFNVEKHSVDGDTQDPDNKMPSITVPGGIVFGSADTGTTAEGDNKKIVTKQTANILDGIVFPHAGTYEYKISEVPNVYTGTGTMSYSDTQYTMSVYVVNDDTANRLKIDKVVISDGTTNSKTGEIKFVNQFKKNSSLTISKTVTGTLGDKTKQFTFTMNLNTLSALETPGTTYTGTITRANGSLATDTSFELSAASNTFTLADGESLVFDHLPVGTIYTVAETNYAADGYSTTVEAMVNGQNTAVSPTNAVIGEDTNRVTFTNTKNNPAPTGILVNNLPFIILILVAVCGFAGYIVFKRRSYKNKP